MAQLSREQTLLVITMLILSCWSTSEVTGFHDEMVKAKERGEWMSWAQTVTKCGLGGFFAGALLESTLGLATVFASLGWLTGGMAISEFGVFTALGKATGVFDYFYTEESEPLLAREISWANAASAFLLLNVFCCIAGPLIPNQHVRCQYAIHGLGIVPLLLVTLGAVYVSPPLPVIWSLLAVVLCHVLLALGASNHHLVLIAANLLLRCLPGIAGCVVAQQAARMNPIFKTFVGLVVVVITMPAILPCKSSDRGDSTLLKCAGNAAYSAILLACILLACAFGVWILYYLGKSALELAGLCVKWTGLVMSALFVYALLNDLGHKSQETVLQEMRESPLSILDLVPLLTRAKAAEVRNDLVQQP
ncbi:unnamed protein product [Effrenium voratum]|nr:unnamed protein product [Effrenium voratum]